MGGIRREVDGTRRAFPKRDGAGGGFLLLSYLRFAAPRGVAPIVKSVAGG